jgi:8-oxo-dGTP pyrophosphatase MutT (NUDIX family)
MKLTKLLNDENISDEEIKDYKHRTAVRVIIFDQDNKIAVVHAKINKYHELPGGGVEKDESLEEGAIRESREEAGCEVKIIQEIGVIKEYLRDKKLINETHCFTAELIGEKNKLELQKDEIEEGMDIIWVDFDKVIELIESNKSESKFATPLQVKYTKVRDITFLKRVKS